MKNFTVVSHPDVLDQLANFYVQHWASGGSQDIADASDLIDSLLAADPANTGSPVTANLRLLTIRPLTVLFAVFEDDRVVMLLEYRWTA